MSTSPPTVASYITLFDLCRSASETVNDVVQAARERSDSVRSSDRALSPEAPMLRGSAAAWNLFTHPALK
jgi:hypothetical protein